MTREEIDQIEDIIHKTIYKFFDVCDDNEEVPMTKKDKLLLEVNKAICNNIKTLEQEPKTEWIPVDKKPPEINCLAIDKFEQIFILKSLVSTTSDGKDRYYDGEGFSFTNGVETFLKGEEIYPGFYVLPTEIKAWMPLPKTYKESEGMI